jgi:hypothetical protein
VGVTISADNSHNQFTPGNTVAATLQLNYSLYDTYIVPLSAITVTQTETYVLLAEDNKVIKREVVTGQVLGEFIEIISGLNPGDQVITTRPGLLQEGEEIEIQN